VIYVSLEVNWHFWGTPPKPSKYRARALRWLTGCWHPLLSLHGRSLRLVWAHTRRSQ